MNNKIKKVKRQEGITLIALIITIIIMIILAAVAIAIAINGGLFDQASEASIKTDRMSTIEKIQTDLTGEIIDKRSDITVDDVKEILKKYALDYEDPEIDYETGIITFPGMMKTLKGNEFELEKAFIWNSKTTNAKKHPDQVNTDDIGVDMYGNPVNLDLWVYNIIEESSYGEIGTYMLTDIIEHQGAHGDPYYSYHKGYIGSITGEGKIEGEIPQYIKEVNGDGSGEFIAVTGLNSTFTGIPTLKQAPTIHSTIINLTGTFSNCTALTEITVPRTVSYLGHAVFSNCNLLEYIFIPNSVITMNGNVITNCNSSLIIDCQVSSKPSGWGSWYYPFSGSYTITWGAEAPRQ